MIEQRNGSPSMNFDTKIEPGPIPTLDDIPIELLECLRSRMDVGRINYGAFDQWKQRMARPGYRKKRLRNMLDHLINIVAEKYDEDDEYGNIGGVLFGCMVLLEFRKREKVAIDNFPGGI